MQTESTQEGRETPAPLPYHAALRDYLKREEPEVWKWFATNRMREEHAESVRFDLLKSTYRLEPETAEPLYTAAKDVAARLGLDLPITLYQAQNSLGLNACVARLPGEAHVVFHGEIGRKLTGPELRALLGHELSHLLLWQGWEGEYLIASQVLSAMANDAQADTSCDATARLFDLYTEIYCDRGSLFVTGDLAAVVSMLIKVQTGLEDVSADSFLRQAEEIFEKRRTKAEEPTHPEAFIRARALRLWTEANGEADRAIAEMIEGDLTLEGLDLLGQQKVADRTRRLIDGLLAARWMQTDAALAHARLFFEDYQPGSSVDLPALAEALKHDDAALKDYYCFVLLDFITVDRDLEELPLAAALALSEAVGLKQPFLQLVRKELKVRVKQLDQIDKEKEQLLEKAAPTGRPT